MSATAVRAAMLGLVLILAGAGGACAETLRFKANLLPVAGTASTASGTLTADYDTDSKKLTWNGTYQGVATYATSASFHGTPGQRAFVRIRDFDSPFEGTAILSDKQAEGLVAGNWSIVVRTAGFPKGELLGKLARN